MLSQTAHYILCPGCEAAVRELSDTPCPECQRCALCGRKLQADETHCNCGLIGDSRHIKSLLRHNEILADQLGRERRRMEIRKELANRKVIISTFAGSVMTFVATIICEAWFGRPAGMLYLALPVMFAFLITTLLISRFFTSLESKRLEAEFPGAENPYQRQRR